MTLDGDTAVRKVGPYRLGAPIGRGGMGIVFRARHEEGGAEVALKTVAVPRPELLQGLRREIHALSRLSHPGVVSVLAHGVAEGIPWYAMEIVEGETLLEHCRRSWRAGPGEPLSPEALREIATLFRRLCAPLAYIHGEGVVHRDLKPANVLVRGNQPVLVDFGLAGAFGASEGRDALHVTSSSGTLAYMAPEQLAGVLPDARVDLYSFGCLLSVALSGELPFATVEEMSAGAPPRLPSRGREGIPRELDRLVGKLLARDPRERIGHASDVAAALERLGAEPGELPGPTPRAYLYRPGMAGREGLLRALEAYVGRVFERAEGTLLLVGGPSGIGKTRVALELARDAEARGALILTGACLPAPAGSQGAGSLQPLAPLFAHVADACRELGVAESARLVGTRGPVLAAAMPFLADVPGSSAWGPPPELPPREARTRLCADAARTISALGEGKHGVLVVLDDLHWADATTLEVLAHLARSAHLGRSRLVLLGTFRSDEAPEALRALAGHPGIRSVGLERLEPDAIGRIVADMLAREPPEGLVRYLAARSTGNPFFVTEYLRAALSEGLLTRDAEGRWQARDGDAAATWESLPLPHALGELVARRLARLSVAARAVAEAASVAGREMPSSLVADVADLEDDALLEAIRELVASSVLEDAGPGRLAFVHDQVRTAARDAIAGSRARELHGRAARALEACADGVAPGTIAAHWEEAGECARAAERYLEAARHAVKAYALHDAARFYEKYLALALPGPGRTEARVRLVEDVLHVTGRSAEGRQQAELAVEEARAAGDVALEAAALQARGTTQRISGAMDAARADYVRARSLWQARGDRTAELRITGRMASMALESGRLDEADRLHEEVRARTGPRQDPRAYGHALAGLALVRRLQGRMAESDALNDEALDVYRQIGERRGEGIALLNLALSATSQGRRAAGEPRLREALTIFQAIGDRRNEAIVLGSLGNHAVDRGELARARELFTQSLAISREIEDLRTTATTLGNLATTLEHERATEAMACLDEALAISRSLEDGRLETNILSVKAQSANDAGDAAGACSLWREVLAQARERDLRPEAAVALQQLARIELARGALDAAAEAATEGLELAEAIDHPSLVFRQLVTLARVRRLRERNLEGAAQQIARAADMRSVEDSPREIAAFLVEQASLRRARGEPGAEDLREEARRLLTSRDWVELERTFSYA